MFKAIGFLILFIVFFVIIKYVFTMVAGTFMWLVIIIAAAIVAFILAKAVLK